MSEQRFERLTRAIARLSATRSMDELTRQVVVETITDLGFDRCGVFLYDPESDRKLGMWGTDPNGCLVDEKGTIASVYDRERPDIFESGAVRILPDTPLYHQDDCIGTGVLIECLVLDQGELLGWLFVDNYRHGIPFTDADLAFIELFASVVGQLIVRQQHHEELQRNHQELTAAMTELEQAQKSLLQSAKLASLGNIVVGVAHELNTPLGTAITASSLVEHHALEIQQSADRNGETGTVSHVQDLVETNNLLMSNLRRAAGLVQDFKALSQPVTEEPFSPVQIALTVRERFDHLSRKFDAVERSSLHLDVPEEDVLFCTAELSFIRILDELLGNAFRHAYPAGKPIDVWIAVRVTADEAVHLNIEDAGCGLSEAERHQLFDPFYTGNRQQGPGLGASVAFNLIVTRLHGSIEAYGSPRGGLGVHLIMPYTSGP